WRALGRERAEGDLLRSAPQGRPQVPGRLGRAHVPEAQGGDDSLAVLNRPFRASSILPMTRLWRSDGTLEISTRGWFSLAKESCLKGSDNLFTRSSRLVVVQDVRDETAGLR